jgi:hypothetical protein
MMMRPFFSLASLHTHSLSLPSPCTTLPEIKSYMYIGHRLLKLFYSNKLISKGKRGFYHFSWHDDPGSGRQENVFRLFLREMKLYRRMHLSLPLSLYIYIYVVLFFVGLHEQGINIIVVDQNRRVETAGQTKEARMKALVGTSNRTHCSELRNIILTQCQIRY